MTILTTFAGRSAPVRPPSAGRLAWWSADYQALNASGDIAAPTEKVATWIDRSGAGKHLAQATDDARPTLTIANGRRTVAFDGSDDTFGAVDLGASVSAIFFVGESADAISSGGSSKKPIVTSNSGSSAHCVGLCNTTSSFVGETLSLLQGGVSDSRCAVVSAAGNVSADAPTAFSFTFRSAGPLWDIRTNGGANKTTDFTSTPSVLDADALKLCFDGAGNYYAFKFREILVYGPDELSLGTINQILTYLRNRHGDLSIAAAT